MSYCYDFIKKFKKEGNFCGLDRAEMSRLESYIEIVDALMKQHRELDEKKIIENFPLGAARVIIPLKDERRTEGLCFITQQLLAKKSVTARDLRSNLEISKKEPKIASDLEISKTKAETASNQGKRPEKPKFKSAVQIDKPAEPEVPTTLAQQQNAKNQELDEKAGTHQIPCPIQPENKKENCISLTTHYLESGESILSCRLNGKAITDITACPDITDTTTTALTPATVKESLTAQEPVKIRPPCLDGKPCPDPDGRDHVVEEKFTRGKVCDLWGLPINQLPRDECALIVRQQKAEAQGFVRATGKPSPLPKIARYPMLPKDKWDEATITFIDRCLRDKYHTIIKRATGDHGKEYPEPLDVITHGLDLVQEEMDRMGGGSGWRENDPPR